MTEISPGARARDALEIQDVFVIRSECWVARDFNPSSPISEFTFGQQSGIEGEGLLQERTPVDGSPAVHIIRYFVTTEVRVLKPGVSVKDRDPVEDDFLAVIKMIFAADYQCPRELLEDREAIGAFSRNAHFHAWPYVREEVHAACARMRLPRITLPMIRPNQPAKLSASPAEK